MNQKLLTLSSLGCALLMLVLAAVLRLEGITQYPPGISRDEAINATYAHNIATSGALTLFEDFEEPEPLYRAILAVGAKAFGSKIALERTISAFIGIVTVAAAYWATLQCLADLPRQARHIGALMAAFSLTIALGHITLSRTLYRGILQPPFMLLTLGFVMRGLRTLRWRDFVIGGVLLGGTIYTYTSAYVTPFAFVMMQVSLTLFRPRQIQRWMPRLVTTAVVALVVLLPFAYRLATVPQSLLGRSGDVSNNQFSVDYAVKGMVSQLFVAGDENPQYNVYEQPVIPPLVQPLFLLGIAALILRIRHPASLYLAVLAVLVSVPALLGNELTHGLRIVGWYGVFPVICGIGAGTLANWLNRWTRKTRVLLVVSLGVCVVAVWTAGNARSTYQSYWQNADIIRLWKVHERELNHSEWFFRTDVQQLVRWINEQDTPILLPVQYANQLVARAWLIEQFPNVATATSYEGVPPNTQILIPDPLGMEAQMRSTRDFVLLNNDTLTLLPPFDEVTHSQIFEASPIVVLEAFGHFDSLGEVYTLPSSLISEAIEVEGEVRFGDDLVLRGVSLRNKLQQGENHFTLYWGTARQPIGHDYMMYLQIQTQEFGLVVGHDERLWRAIYPTSMWRISDVVPQRITLNVPELPAGAYRLVVGVYPLFDKQLMATYNNGLQVANGATVAWLKVPQSTVILPDNLLPVSASFGENFELVGYDYTVSEGNQVGVRLYWRSLVSRPPMDATIFVHVLDADGTIVVQQDTRPQNGNYPTLIWDEGEIVMTEHTFAVAAFDAETMRLRVGMYTLPEVTNLVVRQNGETLPEPFIYLEFVTR